MEGKAKKERNRKRSDFGKRGKEVVMMDCVWWRKVDGVSRSRNEGRWRMSEDERENEQEETVEVRR